MCMHVLKSIFRLAVLILVLVPFAATAHAKTVSMGVFEVDPLIVKKADGSYAGGVIEVIEHIASTEGWEIEYVPCNFPVCLQMLGSGEIDLMGSISYNAERALRYDYTKETFFMDWGVIYVPPGSEIQTIVDLDGKRLAVLRNTIQFPSFMELVESFSIDLEIIFVDDYLDVFRFVRDGKADALMVNRIFGERNAGRFGMHKTSIIFSPMDIRYAVPKGSNRDLLTAIDSNLKELQADEGSVYYKAVSRMFGSVVGFGMPDWLWWAASGVLGLLVVFSLLSFWLRHMVKLRTGELDSKNRQLVGEIREREYAEEDLRISEERYRNFIDSTAEGFWVVDNDQMTVDMNDSLLRMLGYTREEVLGRKPEDFATEESREKILERREEINTSRQRTYDNLVLLKKDGTSLSVIMNATTVFDKEGAPTGSFAFVTDVSALKEAQEKLSTSLGEKEVLLMEVHHRVKNNMQIISSLLSLQGRLVKGRDAKNLFTETRGRIMSMAFVHEQLYQSPDLAHIDVAGYVKTLSEQIFLAYKLQASRTSFEMEVDDISLDIDHLIPAGLILNELLTNAIKYGVAERRDAHVKVSLRADGSDYVMEVSDDGPGLPEGFDPECSETLGVQLIGALVAQLEGELSWQSNGGAKFTVRIPANPDED